MTVHNHDELLKAGEAAELFGTSRKTLRRILIREQVPVLHLNGHYLVRKSDLLALKAAQFKPLADDRGETP